MENIPKKIFIVPYRDRECELNIFKNHMKYILEDIPEEEYEIYIVHQCDTRNFNRGGMRNIGFLIGKEKYPEHYKNIDFIFHDLDNLIGKKNIVDFTTNVGEVNHIFGSYEQINLGGIYVMKGVDYERINGNPNLWGWGAEDDILGVRCKRQGLKHLKKYFNYNNPKVILLNGHRNCFHLKNMNIINYNLSKHIKNGKIYNSGINTISNLSYTQERTDNIIMCNVTNFNIINPEKIQITNMACCFGELKKHYDLTKKISDRVTATPNNTSRGNVSHIKSPNHSTLLKMMRR